MSNGTRKNLKTTVWDITVDSIGSRGTDRKTGYGDSYIEIGGISDLKQCHWPSLKPGSFRCPDMV
jgi:hypothetical protein